MSRDRQQLDLDQNKRKAAEALALEEAKFLRQYAAQHHEGPATPPPHGYRPAKPPDPVLAAFIGDRFPLR